MKNLQLPLKTIWFKMTQNKIKTEDYREITPYWCSRLITVDQKKENIKFWIKWLEKYGVEFLFKIFKEQLPYCGYNYIKFNTNKMTLGYPKSENTEKILILEHKGIQIRTGNPEWGAEPDKLYFVIKHGDILP